MVRLLRYILFLSLSFSLRAYATHIVGGEIFYNYLGNDTYQITLKLYRDCINGLAPYDSPATIFIFNSSGTFIDSIQMAYPGSAQLPSAVNNPCFTPPSNVCVEEAVYQTTVVLPPISGGYNIDYQRCCRNNSILNLVSPGDVGSTYMAHIPDPSIAVGNSSPHFINFPPIFLCEGIPFTFDHAAVDVDGDSLYYELCDPFTGLDPSCPILGPQAGTGCSVLGSPPPFAMVPWLSPYNASYPMSASPALAINPNTGFMTGTPNMVGQWVVGVCVSEYRNGVLIDVNKRDFQFNVLNCPNLPVASIPAQTSFCDGYTVNFTQNSVNASSYYWNFGDQGTLADTSHIASPVYTYPDSGHYTVTLIINQGTICADTSTEIFDVKPLLTANFLAPPGQCIAGNSFNFAGNGGFSANALFDWNFGLNAIPQHSYVQNPANIVYDSVGSFSVIFSVSENGCTRSHTEIVTLYDNPVAHFGISDSLACVLNPFLFLDSSVSSSPLTYNWNFGNGQTSTLQNPTVVYDSAGVYYVNLVVSNAGGCSDSFQLLNPVVVKPSPVADFTITPQVLSIFDSSVVMNDLSLFAVSCQTYWGDGAISNNCDSSHKYLAPGKYTVMQVVVNSLGCHDTAYLDVVVKPEYLFWIPNAFTPDGNDLNDTFKPSLIGVHDYTFLIYDRWGNKIFQTSDSSQGWDGNYKNKLCKNDVYVYKVFFRDDVQNAFHQFVGKVTLLK